MSSCNLYASEILARTLICVPIPSQIYAKIKSSRKKHLTEAVSGINEWTSSVSILMYLMSYTCSSINNHLYKLKILTQTVGYAICLFMFSFSSYMYLKALIL